MKQKGFTLIEMVTSLILFGLLAGTGAVMLSHGVEAYFVAQERTAVLHKLRYAVERVSRELRMCNHNGVAYDVTTSYPSSSSISCVKQDGVTVTISNTGTLLSMTYSSVSGTHILTDQVSVFELRYFKLDGIAALDLSEHEITQINLALDEDSSTYWQTTRVAFRDRQ